MAKKSATTKAKKPEAKKPAAKKPAKPTARPSAVAKSAKTAKPPAKPVAKKPVVKKPTAKEAATKRTPDKAPAKPAAKAAAPVKAATPAATKAAGKEASEPKTDSKSQAAGSSAASGSGTGGAAAGGGTDDKKGGRKGITIVSPKPVKKVKPKTGSTDIAALAGTLMGSGQTRRPLISSGPSAPALRPLGAQGVEEALPKIEGKTPFGKKELEHFRQILIRKRAELFGDITNLETEALRAESGSLSNTPQHPAEQGSETYEQSLNLDLAAADRKLLKEIDEAISRIDAGTYGICELTGKPIKVERLEELPWARYSIEAARELERRSMRA